MRKSEAVCENERAGQGMLSHLLLPVHDDLCVSGMQQGTGEHTKELHLIVCCVMSRKRKEISMLALPFCSSLCLSVGAKITLCSNHAVNYRQQVPPD